MVKTLLARILLSAGSLLILFGVSLLAEMMSTEEERNNISVSVFDGAEHTIEFKDISLVPGESCEYDITLKGENAQQYVLTLDFAELEEKTLKNFARVKILSGDDEICDELLRDVFENEDIVLEVDFDKDKNTELKFVYYLPIDVGNEAKGAEAVFNLLITASDE